MPTFFFLKCRCSLLAPKLQGSITVFCSAWPNRHLELLTKKIVSQFLVIQRNIPHFTQSGSREALRVGAKVANVQSECVVIELDVDSFTRLKPQNVLHSYLFFQQGGAWNTVRTGKYNVKIPAFLPPHEMIPCYILVSQALGYGLFKSSFTCSNFENSTI